MFRLMTAVSLVVLFAASSLSAAAPSKPVKVFILAGQSNMEGKAKVSLMETQAGMPAHAELYAPYRKDGQWIEREDVRVKFLDRQGKLTIGFGSPKCIGPELAFGWVMGDRFEEPVLLIKTAWGGRSLYRDFRPPSAGLPPAAVLEKVLADQQKKKPETTIEDVKKPFGASYRAMLEEISGALANIETLVPGYQKESGYEIAGFVWFQGWNDMISGDATAEYTANMAHFIRDIRKDLKVAKLPFVIGEMGVDGEKASGNVAKFKAAQAAVMNEAEFKGNVAVVKTDVLWDMEADAVFRKGWRENVAEWNTVGSDFPYHYLGSAKCHLRMGKAFAEALLELGKK